MCALRLRQIALVARDLDTAVAACANSLGLAVGHRDPAVAAFGLVNVLLPIGNQFLEVVAPTRAGTAAGRQLDRMGGDGGYMVICQTDDQRPFRTRADELGIRTALDFEDDGYQGWQLHPGDTGGTFLEIDVQPASDDDPWMAAGDNWRQAVRTEVVDAIVGVELAVPDPGATSTRWKTLLGQAEFDNAELRWSTGDRGLVSIDLRATDRNRAGSEVLICGVTFRLV